MKNKGDCIRKYKTPKKKETFCGTYTCFVSA